MKKCYNFSPKRSPNALRFLVFRDADPLDFKAASIGEQCIGMSKTSSSVVRVLVAWRPTPFLSIGGKWSRGGGIISLNQLPRGGVTCCPSGGSLDRM